MRQNLLLVIFIVALVFTAGCKQKVSNAPEASSGPSSSATSPWNLALVISPDHPRMIKPTTFTLHITDSSGNAVDNLSISGSLTMRAMNMGTTQVAFTPKGSGNYEGSVKEMDMSGPWTLTVDALQGTLHAQKGFDFVVGE